MRGGREGENHNKSYCSTGEYPSCRPFPQKLSDMSFASNGQICKRSCQEHEIWTSDKWKRTRDMFREPQGSLQSVMPSFSSETQGRFCDCLGSNIVVQYSVGPIITLHGQITAREYIGRLDNKVHPMIQTFLNNSCNCSVIA
jgi:hypothetical protein